jgi:hypothetical protein
MLLFLFVGRLVIKHYKKLLQPPLHPVEREDERSDVRVRWLRQ